MCGWQRGIRRAADLSSTETQYSFGNFVEVGLSGSRLCRRGYLKIIVLLFAITCIVFNQMKGKAMKAAYRLAAVAVLVVMLSACGAGVGVGVSGGNGHVGASGSVDLGSGNSSVTPYGKVGVGVEVTR